MNLLIGYTLKNLYIIFNELYILVLERMIITPRIVLLKRKCIMKKNPNKILLDKLIEIPIGNKKKKKQNLMVLKKII